MSFTIPSRHSMQSEWVPLPWKRPGTSRPLDQAMRGLLISGTDTGVGKTFLSAAIARCWRWQGRPFRVCKPVATGAEWQRGRLLSEDTLRLGEAAGDEDLEGVTPWTFALPAAPPVAARLAGATLALRDLA